MIFIHYLKTTKIKTKIYESLQKIRVKTIECNHFSMQNYKWSLINVYVLFNCCEKSHFHRISLMIHAAISHKKKTIFLKRTRESLASLFFHTIVALCVNLDIFRPFCFGLWYSFCQFNFYDKLVQTHRIEKITYRYSSWSFCCVFFIGQRDRF